MRKLLMAMSNRADSKPAYDGENARKALSGLDLGLSVKAHHSVKCLNPSGWLNHSSAAKTGGIHPDHNMGDKGE